MLSVIISIEYSTLMRTERVLGNVRVLGLGDSRLQAPRSGGGPAAAAAGGGGLQKGDEVLGLAPPVPEYAVAAALGT